MAAYGEIRSMLEQYPSVDLATAAKIDVGAVPPVDLATGAMSEVRFAHKP